MPNEKKFKRLPWDLWEPLINQLAEEAAYDVNTQGHVFADEVRKAADKLDNRTPDEYNFSSCVRVMRIAVAKHSDGEEFKWISKV